jgi:hypothetical protein
MDENNVSDNDADDEDNVEDAHGVSLGPRLSDSQASSLPSLPPWIATTIHTSLTNALYLRI